ncbi:MAG TPA: hypothetical protein VJL58_05455 [Pyrinomonadaceae bacterium]|nr:hypothetical protein [Pyrinomonadaceae bacterium]
MNIPAVLLCVAAVYPDEPHQLIRFTLEQLGRVSQRDEINVAAAFDAKSHLRRNSFSDPAYLFDLNDDLSF